MKGFVIVVIAAVCALFELACKTQTDVAFNEGGVYNRNVQVIFNRACNTTACHGAAIPQTDSLDLTSYESVLRGSKFGSVVVPYNPEHSVLFQSINNDSNRSNIIKFKSAHPDSTLFFTQADRDTIYHWILTGCKGDDGTSPFNTTSKVLVYVANQGEDVVAQIDITTNQVVRYARTNAANTGLIVADNPSAVVVDRQGYYFYVAAAGSKQLFKFDGPTLAVLQQAPLPLVPSGLAISLGADTLFVAAFDSLNKTSSFVYAFQASSMTAVDTITDPNIIGPAGMRVSGDGRWLFVANQFADNVTQIDLHTLKVVATYPMGSDVPATLPDNYLPKYQPVQVAFPAGSSTIFVSCFGSNDVRAFDTASHAMTHDFAVGKGPMQLRASPDGKTIVVPNHDDNSVSIIDSLYNVTTIPNAGFQPHAAEFSPDGKFVYVSCESRTGVTMHNNLLGPRHAGSTVLIDLTTNKVVPVLSSPTIEMGAMPSGMAITGRTD